MLGAIKIALILVFALIVGGSLCAQNEAEYNEEPTFIFNTESPPEEHLSEAPASVPAQEKTTEHFFSFINKKAYAATVDEEAEKEKLREEWKELLGIDIFHPYFKAKEVEGWVSEKASVKVFKVKGRPKFEDNQIKYIFTVKF